MPNDKGVGFQVLYQLSNLMPVRYAIFCLEYADRSHGAGQALAECNANTLGTEVECKCGKGALGESGKVLSGISVFRNVRQLVTT